MSDSLLYSVKEVSALLGMSYSTVYSYARSGQLPFVKIGGQYFISKEAFNKWFNTAFGGDKF